MATQMQLNVLTWPPGLLERKNNKQSRVFFRRYFLITLTWITEKELERVIENKEDEFRWKKNMEIQSGNEKITNASGQQGAASKVKMSGSGKQKRARTQETKY